jgi:regulation of enolase protein 1 (concanavalin A-like superfamily)
MTRSCSRFLGAAGILFVACTVLAAPPPVLKGWGQASDPDGDCRFEQKEGKLTIRVPGTLHNLVTDGGQVNAPTVLSPVKGDFIAMVKSTGGVRPGPDCSVPDGLPYNGTGLLLWVDRDNYFRLERAGLMRGGAFITYVNFEHFKEGRRAYSEGAGLQDIPTHLRLERRGGSIYASASHDGVHWSPFPPLEVRLPDEVKIGVAAVNSSTKPFAAELEGLSVFTRRDAPSR